MSLQELAALCEAKKDEFNRKGINVSEWAKDNGFVPNDVYRVLNGQSRGTRGRSHDIAVKLGIKPDPNQPSA